MGKQTMKAVERERFINFVRHWQCPIVLQRRVAEQLDAALTQVQAGVYIQLRASGRTYIGEAVDVRKRQKEHLANGVQLAALAVIPFVSATLWQRYAFETELIVQALDWGLELDNSAKMQQARKELALRVQSQQAAHVWHWQSCAAQMVADWGVHGWMTRVARIRAHMIEAQHQQWEQFLAMPTAYCQMHLLNRFVRRIIYRPEDTYTKTWKLHWEFAPESEQSIVQVLLFTGNVFEVRADGQEVLSRINGLEMQPAQLDQWLMTRPSTAYLVGEGVQTFASMCSDDLALLMIA